MKHISITLAAFFMLLAFTFTLSGQAEAAGRAPAADNLEISTKRNIPYTGTLMAHDPDGDLARFEITTNPVKGDIALGEEGHFVYTPRRDRKGRDYFGFRAIDRDGNVSQEATAIIRIEK